MINVGDLVEYVGHGYWNRPKFGIVFHVKKLTRHFEVGVVFGVRQVYVTSKYLEKR